MRNSTLGSIWTGITKKRELICSMKGYVKQALTELEHLMDSDKHQAAPSKMTRLDYGSKVQYVYDDNGEPLAEKKIRRIQRVIGKFLYYDRAIDITMQHAINVIGIAAAKATTTTEKQSSIFSITHIAIPTPNSSSEQAT